MRADLDMLLDRCGRFGGHGIDSDDQPLYGELDLNPLPARQGAWLTFKASAIDGTLLHDERSWVALDPDGRLCMWTVSTLAEGVRNHPRRHGAATSGAEATLVFGSGDRLDESVYRTEISIDLWPEGAIGYRSAWGLPGGAFLPRSQVRMEREP